jgi:hypothetical protein
MLTFALILTAELLFLFRLMLPRFLAFAERRYDDVYNVSDGDCRLSTVINHDGGV